MKPMFRNSMFGFNKSDVVRFISKQSEMHDAKITELNGQIESLKRDYEKEIEELSCDRAALEALQEDHLKKLDAVLQIKRLAEELRSAKEAALQNAEKSKNYTELVCDDVENLKSALSEADRYREKADRFDQLAGVLSGIVNGGEVAVPAVSSTAADYCVKSDLNAFKKASDEQLRAVTAIGEKLDFVSKLLETFAE